MPLASGGIPFWDRRMSLEWGVGEERAPLGFGECRDRTHGPACVRHVIPPVHSICLNTLHALMLDTCSQYVLKLLYLPLHRVACTKPCVHYFRASLRGFSGVNGSIYDYFSSCLSRELRKSQRSYKALARIIRTVTFESGYLYSLSLFHKWQRRISETLRNWLITSFQMEEVEFKSRSV